MNNKRKTRPNASRSPRTRPERSVTADGIYQNPHFMHAVTSHVGNNVLVSTLNGSVFEGVFRTFSSQFDVVLEMAHKVNIDDPSKIDIDTVVEKLIFKPEDIVTIEVRDCDLEYATRDTFQTDTAISKFNGNVSGERELEPWDEPGCNGDEFDLDSNSSLGWDPNEMFRKNERDYGVQSSFQPSMESYTVPLQKKDTKEFKDAEAKAAKIASEIESNPNYKARAELENGDEEERFAAVIRPDGQGEAGKYLPPQKRKTGPAPPTAGKGVRSTPPPQPQISQPSQQPAAVQQQQLPQLSSSNKAYPPLPQTNSYHHPVIFSVSQQQGQQQQSPQQQLPPQQQAQSQAAQPQNTPQLPLPRHPSPGSPVVSVGIREPKVNGMEPKAQRTPQIRTGSRAFSNVESQGHLQGHTKQHPAAITPSSVPPAPFPSAGTGASMSPQGQPSQQASLPTVHQTQSPLPASPSPVRSPANEGVGIVPSVAAPPAKIADQQTAPASVQQQQQQQAQQPPLPSGAPNHSQGSLPRSKGPAGRGRDEQLAELKKFGQDFKLAEVDSSDRKQHQNSTAAPQQSVPHQLPQHQVQTAQSQQQQPLIQQQQPQPPASSAQQQQPPALPTQQQQQPPAVQHQQHQPQQQQPTQQTEEHKEQGESADKVSNALKKSTLNPNAKEFVYNPNAKPFTPRSPSTPTPSRPHTPQTPQFGTAMAMVVPTYVVTTSQPAFTNPNQGNRFRKIQVMPHRNDIASQMSVAAATGQPLLAPAPAPMHSQFTVPYAPPGHMTPQPYHQQQMVRMVAQHGGGVVPLGAVPTSVSYHHESPGPQPGPGPQLQYVPAAHAAAVGPPHPHHPHHPHHAHHHAHHHAPPPPPPPSGGGPGTPSPAQAAGNPGGPPHAHAAAAAAAAAQGAPTYHHHPGGSPAAGTPGGPAGYQQGPPPPPQGPHPPGPAPPPPHAFPVVCPILPTQQLGPPHAHAPHHVVQQAGAVQQAAAAVQYIHQHQGAYHHQHPAAAVGSGQPHPIQVILPHNQ